MREFRSPSLWIRRLDPGDFFVLERQPSQWLQLGEDATPAFEDATALAEEDEAWACVNPDGRIVALLGIVESHPGQQGMAWAILATRIGGDHLAVSRFARSRILGSPLNRIEALAKGGGAAPTPEMRWAALCGLKPAHTLRRYGAADETYTLCERIRDVSFVGHPPTGEANG